MPAPAAITDLRRFVDSVGGIEDVGYRLGVQPKAVYRYAGLGQAGAGRYAPLCRLADEFGVARPSIDWFHWKKLRPLSEPDQLMQQAQVMENTAARLRARARAREMAVAA